MSLLHSLLETIQNGRFTFRNRRERRASAKASHRRPALRPRIEALETHLALSSIVIGGPSPVALPVGTVHKGDVLQFKIEAWQLSDADDPGEGEPLVLKSSQVTGPIATYAANKTGFFAYTAKADGETFSALIRGGDGDEQVSVVTPSQGIDLALSVDSDTVVPTQAKDLNLFHVFGNESLTIPVTIENQGLATATGPVSVALSMSKTPDLKGTPISLGSQTVNLNLKSLGDQAVTFNITIPGKSLAAGSKYYFVARLTSTAITESDVRNGQDPNNTAATDRTFAFLGTPSSNPAVFTNGMYFGFVRDALKGVSAAPGVNLSDPKSFIGRFEGDQLYPYLDSKKIPTIGVGINLNTVSGTLRSGLAAAVRSYYLATYKTTLLRNDDTVIAMLRAEAGVSTKPAISTADDLKLSNAALQTFATATQKAMGPTWPLLSAREQVALIDLSYNTGGVFPGVKSALGSGDFVLAGFNLVDAVRTTQAPGLTTRTEAEFENLLAAHLATLGQIVP